MNELPIDMGGIVPGGMVPPVPPVQPDGQNVPIVDTNVPTPEPIIKGDLQDWVGGTPVNLKRKTSGGKTLGEELSAHIRETLDQELKNQEKVKERLERWHKLYKGEPTRTPPKRWMANISIPVARKISDSIFVRIHDMIWNKQRVYLCRPKKVNPTQADNDKYSLWEKAFNYFVKHDLKLKDKMRFPTRQCVNSGTGLVKIVYEEKNRPIYRYANELERLDSGVKKYKAPGGVQLVKEPSIVFRGPNVYPVDRARFVISSDALTIDDAYLVGFSFDKRKNQLEVLGKKGVYLKDAVDKLTADEFDETKEARSTGAGSDLQKTKYTEPYTLWEVWLRYDVDDDGEEDDIVVTFHKESGQILKAIYNPIFYGYRPFVDFKGASQVEYTWDGEGICEIIEGMSEELDTLHNLMLDRLKLVNLPITFVRSGIGLDNYDLEPGTVKPIDGDPNADIRELKMSDATFSLVNEINWLISQMDLVCGIVPGALGMSTAERPVAKAELVNQEEYNKKFKSWTDNFRIGYNEIGYRLFETMAQYRPTYEFTDEQGQKQVVEMPTGNIRDYLELDLAVSSEEWNMTMRRESALQKWQLYREHLTGNMAIAQILANPTIPSDAKKYALQINDIGCRLLDQVAQNFEDVETETTNASVRKTMDVEKCISASPDVLQMAVQQAQQMLNQQAGLNPDGSSPVIQGIQQEEQQEQMGGMPNGMPQGQA